MSKSKGTPRKFSEKIALLNKKEAEANAEFIRIIKEVEETTRAPIASYSNSVPSSSNWVDLQGRYGGQPQVESFIQYNEPQDESFDTMQLSQRLLNTNPNTHTAMVPNIQISPIVDETSYHQQVLPNTSSNPISSSRSLPDIANLNVSSSFSSPMVPSYSDQRIQSELEYNCNIESNSPTNQSYFPQTPDANQRYEINSWQENSCNQQDYQNFGMASIEHQRLNQPQQQDHVYYPEPNEALIIRANSTNTVSNDWNINNNNNNNNATLCAPKLNNNLSRSTDGCYGCPYQNNSLDSGGSPVIATGHRVRSISYNNVGPANSQANSEAARYSQQQAYVGSPQFYG